MLSVKVKDRQTILDIAVIGAGDVSAFLNIALLNGVSITDDLESGQVLIIDSVVNKKNADYLAEKKARPASAIQNSSFAITGSNLIVKPKIIDNTITKANQFQNLLDIAVLTSGDVTAVIELALLNGIGVTDDLVSGQVIKKVDAKDAFTLNELKARNARTATALLPELPQNEGIGYWIIEDTFIVQ